MASVFNKKLTRPCKYCLYSTELNFTKEVLCKKRGISDSDGCCRHYKYDPLKREPVRQTIDKEYTKEDFEI